MEHVIPERDQPDSLAAKRHVARESHDGTTQAASKLDTRGEGDTLATQVQSEAKQERGDGESASAVAMAEKAPTASSG